MASAKVVLGEILHQSDDGKRIIFKAVHAVHKECIAKVQKFGSLDQLNRTVREVFMQAKIKHQMFCQALDFQITSKSDCYELLLCMEKLDKDLSTEISDRDVPYSEEELWTFLKTMVEGLSYAQKQNICHRDIKPSNIFVRRKGSQPDEYKIGDFGEARLSGVGSNEYTTVGTLCYMAPKLRTAYSGGMPQAIYDPYRSDVYSLGLTLYSMATLCVLTTIEEISQIEKGADNKIESLTISDDLKSVLRRMLAFEEEARPDFVELEGLLSLRMIADGLLQVAPGQLVGRGVFDRSMQPARLKVEKVGSSENAVVLDTDNPFLVTTFSTEDGSILLSLSKENELVKLWQVNRDNIFTKLAMWKLAPGNSQQLQAGQIFKLGNYFLIVEDLLPEEITPNSPVPPLKFRWTAERGAGGGEEGTMPLSAPLTIGRNADNGLRLNDSTVSGLHARCNAGPGGFFIEDCFSRNGVFLCVHSMISIREMRDSDPLVVSPGLLVAASLDSFRFFLG